MSPVTSMVVLKNTAHFARYLRGIFDNEENTSQKIEKCT
jgi:hypothetical protein